jgi:hypothetical protein
MPRMIERVPKTIQTFERIITYTCDKCGDSYDEDQYFINELEVWLDRGQCVSYGHKRYYCGTCSEAIWNAICKAIDADPDSEEKTGFDDEG